MQDPAAPTPTPKAIAPFQKGQVWKIGDLSVAVTLVGKTLVHYKRYKVKRPGNPNTMSSKLDLQKYLLSNKAVLVTE